MPWLSQSLPMVGSVFPFMPFGQLRCLRCETGFANKCKLVLLVFAASDALAALCAVLLSSSMLKFVCQGCLHGSMTLLGVSGRTVQQIKPRTEGLESRMVAICVRGNLATWHFFILYILYRMLRRPNVAAMLQMKIPRVLILVLYLLACVPDFVA